MLILITVMKLTELPETGRKEYNEARR